MKRKFKNITIPYYYYDKNKNYSYYIYKDNIYTELNELFKVFVNTELTYHVEVKKQEKEVHNLTDVAELLLENYKTFKIPRKYYDEYSKDELSYFTKLQKKLINHELTLFNEPSYNYVFKLRDLPELKNILFSKKMFKKYKDIILPRKVYSKEKDTYYFVTGGNYYKNVFYALEDVYDNSFYYQYGGPNRENLYDHFHSHEFGEVVHMLFNYHNKFKIHKFQEEFFSKQEKDLLNKICSKLKELNYKPVSREYKESEYEEYCYLKDNKKYIRLFFHNLKDNIKDYKFHKEDLKSHKIKTNN